MTMGDIFFADNIRRIELIVIANYWSLESLARQQRILQVQL